MTSHDDIDKQRRMTFLIEIHHNQPHKTSPAEIGAQIFSGEASCLIQVQDLGCKLTGVFWGHEDPCFPCVCCCVAPKNKVYSLTMCFELSPPIFLGRAFEFHTGSLKPATLRNISCVVLGRAPGAESLQEQAEMIQLHGIFLGWIAVFDGIKYGDCPRLVEAISHPLPKKKCLEFSVAVHDSSTCETLKNQPFFRCFQLRGFQEQWSVPRSRGILTELESSFSISSEALTLGGWSVW